MHSICPLAPHAPRHANIQDYPRAADLVPFSGVPELWEQNIAFSAALFVVQVHLVSEKAFRKNLASIYYLEYFQISSFLVLVSLRPWVQCLYPRSMS